MGATVLKQVGLDYVRKLAKQEPGKQGSKQCSSRVSASVPAAASLRDKL